MIKIESDDKLNFKLFFNSRLEKAPTAIFMNNTPKQEDKPYKSKTFIKRTRK